MPEFAATSQELRDYAAALGAPYCGTDAPFESREWFEGLATLASFAFLPLRTHQTFGLLGLGSEDANRFYAGMGTMYLTRLAELASAIRDRLHAKYDADEIRQSWITLIEADSMGLIKVICQLPYLPDGKTDPIARPVMQIYLGRLAHEKYADLP